MKKTILNIFMALAILGGTTGCNYLDVDPELGTTEETVFSTYTNAMSFFDTVYDAYSGKNKVTITLCYPFYLELLQQYYCSWNSTTDASDAGRLGVAQRNFKQCNLSQDLLTMCTFSTLQADKPIGTAMFGVIRIANKTIANFGMLTNGTEKERNDLLGQAYFVRGLAHFNLCRYFGGMPYIDYVIGADDEWDIPRLSAYETYVKAAEDLKKAAELLEAAGYVRRNTPEDLASNTTELQKPSAVIALAVRARALMYAASPLNNTVGEEAWANAAAACSEALQMAIQARFELVPLGSYNTNYYGQLITNETFWAYNLTSKHNVQNFAGMLSYCQSKLTGVKGSSGLHPTQNFVDRFETADGFMLNTQAQRDAAEKAGSFNEQNPYANRDPRMDLVIVHDGSPAFGNCTVAEGQFNIYYDPATDTYPITTINKTAMYYADAWGSGDNNTQGVTNTGYYCKRYWDGSFDANVKHSDPMFRLGELYLNYAECVNEAYGPDGSVPGYSLTASQAVDVIRSRANMPSVKASMQKCGESVNKDNFRERIRNERCVELAYESNHYYFDIRRWKIAPQTMSQTLEGIWIEKVAASAQYPNGRKYTRKAIPSNRQGRWKDCMYVLPFPDSQANTMKNFVNNEQWQ